MQGAAMGESPQGEIARVPNVPRSAPGLVRADVAAELIFLGLVAVIFVYFLVDARSWPIGAALLPTVVACAGMVLLGLHIAARLRPSTRPARQILDIAFGSLDVDEREQRVRTARMLCSILLLFLGIWLVGFHVALPTYVFAYLLFFGHVRWWWAVTAAVVFELLILGVYDRALHTAWNTPVLHQLLGIGR
jgi:hypothetical protein